MITIIPDIHGRVFWKKAVDSMDFKKSNPERVVLLLGNHDCEYMYSRNVCDCRCDRKNYDIIQSLFRDNWKLFQCD